MLQASVRTAWSSAKYLILPSALVIFCEEMWKIISKIMPVTPCIELYQQLQGFSSLFGFHCFIHWPKLLYAAFIIASKFKVGIMEIIFWSVINTKIMLGCHYNLICICICVTVLFELCPKKTCFTGVQSVMALFSLSILIVWPQSFMWETGFPSGE